jgi:hypothetical protein
MRHHNHQHCIQCHSNGTFNYFRFQIFSGTDMPVSISWAASAHHATKQSAAEASASTYHQFPVPLSTSFNNPSQSAQVRRRATPDVMPPESRLQSFCQTQDQSSSPMLRLQCLQSRRPSTEATRFLPTTRHRVRRLRRTR